MRGAILALVLLAGCREPVQAPATPTPTPTPAPAIASSAPAPSTQASATLPATEAPASLVGEYRVAGIDGAPLDADFGIAVSIDRGRISFEPRCAGFVWDYRYEGGVLSTERAAGYGPTRQPDGSIAVCAVGVAPEQRRLGEAIDAATRAARSPANAVELSGGGRSVTLFSQ